MPSKCAHGSWPFRYLAVKSTIQNAWERSHMCEFQGNALKWISKLQSSRCSERPCYWCVSEVLLLWVIHIDCSLCDSSPLCSSPLTFKPSSKAGGRRCCQASDGLASLGGHTPYPRCPPYPPYPQPPPAFATTHHHHYQNPPPTQNTLFRHTARQGQRSLSALPWRCRTGEM